MHYNTAMAPNSPNKPNDGQWEDVSNQNPPQPMSQAGKPTENDPVLVGLRQLAGLKKERSVMDQVGGLLQLLTSLATLFFLIYGFAKFWKLGELAKTRET